MRTSGSGVAVKEEMAIAAIREGLSRAKNPFVVFTGDKDSLVVLHIVKQIAKASAPVLHIDTTANFHEIYLYIEKMRKLWGFRLFREKNDEALKTIEIAKDGTQCCEVLKAQALRMAIEKHDVDYLFVAVGPDKEEIGSCICVNPIVSFTEEDIWNHIKHYNVPYCSLYDRGYRDISCVPCTAPRVKESESGEDEEEIIEKLRALSA